MANPSWYFTRRRPSTGRARNSQVDKFFRSDVVEDQTNAIVREGIQNSLDAGIADNSETGKSVAIQILFGSCSCDEIAEFVPGLFDHLEAIVNTGQKT